MKKPKKALSQPLARSSRVVELDVVTLGEIREELESLEEVLAAMPGVMRLARPALAAACGGEPRRRDAVAWLWASLAGIDIDVEEIDDERAREFADAAATVVEAVRWRLGRVVRLMQLMADGAVVSEAVEKG